MNQGPLTLPNPLDLQDARAAMRQLREQRLLVEQELEDATLAAAEAEANYRKQLSLRFVNYRAEGTPVTECETRARGDVSELSKVRDIKNGMVTVLRERLRGIEGDRANLRLLADWSARLNLDEGPDGA